MQRKIKYFPVATNVKFKQDRVNNHTIMEIKTTDSPGVLSRIAEAFRICEVRVKNAKITTFSSHVEDVFFITDYGNHALFSTTQLDGLRKKLSELLDKED